MKNHPPAATAPPVQSSVEGAAVSLTITAADPDDDALAFTATGLPPNLTINAAGVIAGTINPGAAGVYTVRITVSDGRLTDTATFRWRVTQTGKAGK